MPGPVVPAIPGKAVDDVLRSLDAFRKQFIAELPSEVEPEVDHRQELPEGATYRDVQPALPEGATLRAPDQQEEEEKNQRFALRFGRDLDARAKMGAAINERINAGETQPDLGVMQIVGKVGFGSAWDGLGQLFSSTFDVAGTVIGAITPDIIEDPIKDGASYARHAVMGQPLAIMGMEALEQGMVAWQGFKQKHPEWARTIEATVNIGAVLNPPAKKVASAGGAATAKANALKAAANEQIKTRQAAVAATLAKPLDTPTQAKLDVPRNVEVPSVFPEKFVTQPTRQDVAAAVEFAKVEGLGQTKKTIQGNYNLVDDAVTAEANRLRTTLGKLDIHIPPQEVAKALDEAVEIALTKRLLTSESGQHSIVRQIRDAAKQIYNDLPLDLKNTAEGLLIARRELDSWVTNIRGQSVFEAGSESATKVAVREIRTSMNKLINKKVNELGVGEADFVANSLLKQSNLLHGLENMLPKAAQEANTALGRTWQKIMAVSPKRSEFNQAMAAATGLGGLGAAATFAPIFTAGLALTGTAYIGGRVVMAPGVKESVGIMLKEIDVLLGSGTLKRNIATELRAERAILMELINEDATNGDN